MIFKKVRSRKSSRFKKPWAKLEKGNKLNRLNLYIQDENHEKELNEDASKKLKNYYILFLRKVILSKSSEIEYCTCKNLKI